MKRHTCWVTTEDAAPVEICFISDSDSVSFMTVSIGACWSFAGACLCITAAGLVSVNSTESATDGVEKDEQGEGGPGFRASSPKACTGLMLDVFLASWSLVALVVWVVFERLCCSMLQSAHARSSSVVCSLVALACQQQQCNQTSKRTCIADAADGALEADAPLEPAKTTLNGNVGSNAACFCLAGTGIETDAAVTAACRLVVLIRTGMALKGVSAGHSAFSPRSSIIDVSPFSNAVKVERRSLRKGTALCFANPCTWGKIFNSDLSPAMSVTSCPSIRSEKCCLKSAHTVFACLSSSYFLLVMDMKWSTTHMGFLPSAHQYARIFLPANLNTNLENGMWVCSIGVPPTACRLVCSIGVPPTACRLVCCIGVPPTACRLVCCAMTCGCLDISGCLCLSFLLCFDLTSRKCEI